MIMFNRKGRANALRQTQDERGLRFPLTPSFSLQGRGRQLGYCREDNVFILLLTLTLFSYQAGYFRRGERSSKPSRSWIVPMIPLGAIRMTPMAMTPRIRRLTLGYSESHWWRKT